MGLGTCLINEIKRQFSSIYLECWNENKTALEFYKFHDFKVFDSSENSTYLVWKQC